MIVRSASFLFLRSFIGPAAPARAQGDTVLLDALRRRIFPSALPGGQDQVSGPALPRQPADDATRGVARGLFPVRLEENGLVSALEELAAEAQKHGIG